MAFDGSIPAISKTPPPESETPIAGGMERDCEPLTPPEAPLWDELVSQTVKSTNSMIQGVVPAFASVRSRRNSSATISDINDDPGRLTPLELRAMGPVLMPHEELRPLDDSILQIPENASPPLAKDLDLLLKEYCITKRMNQVIVSDSLASKRQVWLDASAGMWQSIAKKQAADAFHTATALKEKEAKLEAALQTVANMEDHLEEIKVQIKLQEDILSDRKKRVQRATTELDLKCAQRRCITGEGTEAEVEEFTSQIADKLARIKEREEHLLRKEIDLAEMESKMQSGMMQLQTLDSKSKEITESLSILNHRESACKTREEQLEKDNAEYTKSRELLLFEYAEIAERESAVDAKEQAASSHWSAACKQQASLDVVVSTFNRFFSEFQSTLAVISDIANSHFDTLSELFSTSVIAVLTNSSSNLVTQHQQRQQQQQPQIQNIPPPKTPSSRRSCRGVVLSPAANEVPSPEECRNTDTAGDSNVGGGISSLEASLRDRYIMRPGLNNLSNQHPYDPSNANICSYYNTTNAYTPGSYPAPTHRPISVPSTPRSFEHRLKERLRETSYESRLKELLHRNTTTVSRDVESPQVPNVSNNNLSIPAPVSVPGPVTQSHLPGSQIGGKLAIADDITERRSGSGDDPMSVSDSHSWYDTNINKVNGGGKDYNLAASAHTSPSVSRGRFRVGSPSASYHVGNNSNNGDRRFGTPAQRRVSAPPRDIVSPSLGASSTRVPLAGAVDVVFQQINDMESFLSNITATTAATSPPASVRPSLNAGGNPSRRTSSVLMTPLVPP